MTLATGTRLGPYEVQGLLGAGGMGEVYRARDTRLGREVAVKVLPRSMAGDPERQQRFEAEARAAGALNHANIVTLHDVGVADGTPYIVTEILEGESLRDVILSGPVAPSRAVDLIVQLANGLTAAHRKGIVHRDLKPENLFLLTEGRLKILDFGIAKLTRNESVSEAETTPVFASLTVAGTIMGTVSYMAPEQLRDKPVDQRADLFALGAIFYELLTGKQPFVGETAADRVSAILTADPPTLPEEVERSVPGVGAVITRLLAKRPEGRLDSAADLAFLLSLLRGRPGPAQGAADVRAETKSLRFRQLTFRDGEIGNARFTPDGQTLVYDAAWGGGKNEVYVTRVESPEARPLGVSDATVQGVSSLAEVAVCLRPKDAGGFISLGTLARVPLVGGRPREITDSVSFADWSPDGRSLAAIRFVGSTCQIEAPIGRAIHSTQGWMSHLRYSPDGTMLAFLDHPTPGNNAGCVTVIRPGESPRQLNPPLETIWRLAWRPDGKEIWYGAGAAVHGVTLDGVTREIYAAPGWVLVDDIGRNGDALLSMNRPCMRLETGLRTGDFQSVIDLSHLDWSLLRDLSPDGSTVLFDETGLGSEGNSGVYMRPTDGGPAIRLADGTCSGISPDGRFVLTTSPDSPTAMLIVPTGIGETRRLEVDSSINYAEWAGPDAVVFVASKGGGPRMLYRLDLATEEIRLVGDGVPVRGTLFIVSPDDAYAAVRDPNDDLRVVRLEDGSSRRIPNLETGVQPAGWTADSRGLYVWRRSELPCQVRRVDVASGDAEPWCILRPMMRSGVHGFNSIRITPDGERYAASYVMIDSRLFLARGLA